MVTGGSGIATPSLVRPTCAAIGAVQACYLADRCVSPPRLTAGDGRDGTRDTARVNQDRRPCVQRMSGISVAERLMGVVCDETDQRHRHRALARCRLDPGLGRGP